MKKFKKMEITSIKNTAKTISNFAEKKERFAKQIAEFQEEIDSLDRIIEGFEEPIKKLTGGYGSLDLVVKIVTECNGKKSTKYELKYPATVIPEESVNLENAENKTPVTVEVENLEEFENAQSEEESAEETAAAQEVAEEASVEEEENESEDDDFDPFEN